MIWWNNVKIFHLLQSFETEQKFDKNDFWPNKIRKKKKKKKKKKTIFL